MSFEDGRVALTRHTAAPETAGVGAEILDILESDRVQGTSWPSRWEFLVYVHSQGKSVHCSVAGASGCQWKWTWMRQVLSRGFVEVEFPLKDC